MTNPDHLGWLLPVRTDLDGTVLVLCHVDYEVGTPTDGWALWCPDCQRIVSEIAPGTEGVQDVDGLSESDYAQTAQVEARLVTVHACSVQVADSLAGALAAATV